MINFFLNIKAWKLFLMMVGIPILLQMLFFLGIVFEISLDGDGTPEGIMSFFTLFIAMMLIFMSVFFSWFWSIVHGFDKKIPPALKLKTGRFKFFFFFPLFYMIFFLFLMAGAFDGIETGSSYVGPGIFQIILPLHLFAMFCMFYMVYFVSKTIKTAELQKKVGFGDYIAEFFLLWFYIIGIWFIQPKVNKLANSDFRSLIDTIGESDEIA